MLKDDIIGRWTRNPEDDFTQDTKNMLSDAEQKLLLDHYNAVIDAVLPFGTIYLIVLRDAQWNRNKLQTAIGIRAHVRAGK